jgi:hypothetical protein
MSLAATFTVSGAHGVLTFIAVLAFAAAAVISVVAPAHKYIITLIAAGLALWALAGLWS